MNIISLLISLASGAAGGNIMGTLLKKMSLGPVGNSIAGILGGGLGATILNSLGVGGGGAGGGGGTDLASIISSICGGGVGGGVVMAVVAAIKNAMAKKA